MPILSLIAVATILQTQYAPADVPKDHWAFPAVDTLFREGLLKGYPAGKQPALKLDKSIKQDLEQAKVWVREWKAKGLLIGFYLDHYGRGRELSNYELAAATYHASMESMENLIIRSSEELSQNLFEELPNMAKAIAMFSGELVKLGADPEKMIAKVNDLYQSQYRLFYGDRL